MAVDVPFLGGRAREPLVQRCSAFPSLWSAVQKNIPRRPPQNPRAPIAIYTLSRPEHENNEPALGVAEPRGSTWNERAQTRGKGTAGALCASQVARPRKRNRHRLFSQRTSQRPVGVDPCTLDVPRVNGEGLVDVEMRWRLYSHVTAAAGGTAASSKFTSNEQNFVRG